MGEEEEKDKEESKDTKEKTIKVPRFSPYSDEAFMEHWKDIVPEFIEKQKVLKKIIDETKILNPGQISQILSNINKLQHKIDESTKEIAESVIITDSSQVKTPKLTKNLFDKIKKTKPKTFTIDTVLAPADEIQREQLELYRKLLEKISNVEQNTNHLVSGKMSWRQWARQIGFMFGSAIAGFLLALVFLNS